ncbi:UNVERIFIED_ORG: hypothetical protein J2W66_004470 [Agrobacterium larrymoorei]|nr:hypothetical protein [Agrobacterium larrymoorei]
MKNGFDDCLALNLCQAVVWGQNKSSPKSYAKAERSMNNAIARIWGVRSLWIAIDIRWF